MGQTAKTEPDLTAEHNAMRRAVEIGLAQVNAGQRIPLAAIEAWVMSWDTPDELPIPLPRPTTADPR